MNKRNYELTLNVTTGKIKIPSISIYNTDKGIFNIKLFLEKGEGKNIVKLTHDEMVNYKALFQAVKSKTKNYVELEGILDETENFFYYDLGSKFNDQVGVYNCQIFVTDTKGTKDNTTDDEIVTSVPFNYSVTASILTGLNAEITANPDLPVLKELINECKILMKLDNADMSVLNPFQKKEDDAIDGADKNIISNINSINSQIKDKATKQEIEVERKRIDSFTSLQEGSTTGDAELIDARVGVDGFVYDNIGGAIRTQFDNIDNEKVNKTDLYIFNMLNPNTITKDKYSEYGVEKDYTGWNVTNYIKIDNTNQYSLFIINSDNEKEYATNVYVDQFNSNKKYISDSTLKGKKLSDMTFTDDTMYIKISTTNKYICETGIISLTSNENHINKFINFGSMIDLKDSRITDIEDNIEEILGVKSLQYNNIIRSICRIGYDVYSSNTPPQQSISSFKLAYEKGFRILLCNLRFTSDNVPVLHHDDNINTYAKNNDGTSISETVVIANTTFSKLLEYDYGIYKGEQYKGTKIMHLKDMLKLTKNLGCELYIEVKSMNEEQCKIACDLVKLYKMETNTSWAGTMPQMRYVVSNIQSARVSTMPQVIQDSTINDLVSLKTGKNKIFFFAWDITELSKELVDKLILNEIEFEMGTLNSEKRILNYFNKDDLYYYCTGISSDKIIAGKVILENEIL